MPIHIISVWYAMLLQDYISTNFWMGNIVVNLIHIIGGILYSIAQNDRF